MFTEFKKNTDQFVVKKWFKRNEYGNNRGNQQKRQVQQKPAEVINNNPEVKPSVIAESTDAVSNVS